MKYSNQADAINQIIDIGISVSPPSEKGLPYKMFGLGEGNITFLGIENVWGDYWRI